MNFTQEFLLDRGRHLVAKLEKTREALLREGLLDAARGYKIHVLIPQIIEAQKRLDDGTYGVCIDCTEPIEKGRLLKHPQVARCVDCQSLAEK